MKNNPNHSANRGKLFGSARKGITAVVAIVLLLMMTVGAAGLAYVWVSGLQSSIQESASQGVEDVTAQQEAKIGIDSMWNASGIVTFNLRNSGRYAFPDASKFKIYVNGKPTAGAVGGLSGAFAPKDVKTITLSVADAIFPTPGSPRTFKVFTDIEGVAISYRCSVSTVNQTYC